MSEKPSYEELERRLADALQYKAAHPEATYRQLQAQFKVDKDKICRRYRQKQGSRYDRGPPSNTRLSPDQDKALCSYLEFLAKFGIPLVYRRIATATNHILRMDNPESSPVSKNWPRRWSQSHPEFNVVKEKSIDQEQTEAMNVYNISRWFSKVQATMNEYNICPEDFWNMDEMRLRIGVGRNQWVAVPPDNKYLSRLSHIIGDRGDREQCTVVESASASGRAIPPLVIIKGGLISERWFAQVPAELDKLLVGTSDSGGSNDSIFWRWLQHWEHFTSIDRRGEYRLLLMDGCDSHFTYSALEFCKQHKIIVMFLPPHTSHFLQPLEVSIFRQWKHNGEALDQNVRQGTGPFDKHAFFTCLQGIREKTVTEEVIKMGFSVCGYSPFRPRLVLEELVGVLLDMAGAEESGERRREQ